MAPSLRATGGDGTPRPLGLLLLPSSGCRPSFLASAVSLSLGITKHTGRSSCPRWPPALVARSPQQCLTFAGDRVNQELDRVPLPARPHSDSQATPRLPCLSAPVVLPLSRGACPRPRQKREGPSCAQRPLPQGRVVGQELRPACCSYHPGCVGTEPWLQDRGRDSFAFQGSESGGIVGVQGVALRRARVRQTHVTKPGSPSGQVPRASTCVHTLLASLCHQRPRRVHCSCPRPECSEGRPAGRSLSRLRGVRGSSRASVHFLLASYLRPHLLRSQGHQRHECKGQHGETAALPGCAYPQLCVCSHGHTCARGQRGGSRQRGAAGLQCGDLAVKPHQGTPCSQDSAAEGSLHPSKMAEQLKAELGANPGPTSHPHQPPPQAAGGSRTTLALAPPAACAPGTTGW